MDTDLDDLATALYVTCDDRLKAHPERVTQKRPGCFSSRTLAAVTGVGDDSVWLADSTPVECGRSRQTTLRSDLADWAEHGYCASHSRFFWGLRLHLLTTLHGVPIGWTLTAAKADERHAPHDIITSTPGLAELVIENRPTIIADKGYYGRTIAGVCARIAQRVLALTTAIWHNDRNTTPTHPNPPVTARLRPLTPGINHLAVPLVPGGARFLRHSTTHQRGLSAFLLPTCAGPGNYPGPAD
ncbi:MAG: transposase [Gordonia sp. (in: high G+C Gram-positive bacteria)]